MLLGGGETGSSSCVGFFSIILKKKNHYLNGLVALNLVLNMLSSECPTGLGYVLLHLGNLLVFKTLNSPIQYHFSVFFPRLVT